MNMTPADLAIAVIELGLSTLVLLAVCAVGGWIALKLLARATEQQRTDLARDASRCGLHSRY